MYNSSNGTIKIDGIEENNSIISKSYIKIKWNKEIKFYELDENFEESILLNNVIGEIKYINHKY